MKSKYLIQTCLFFFVFTLTSPMAEGEGASPQEKEKAEAPQETKWQWPADQALQESPSLWHDVSDLAFSERSPWQTNAVLIIKDGRIVYEKYAHGFYDQKPHRLWSISKSFTSALVGIRWHQRGWSLNRPAYQLLEELNKPLKKLISMRHLLQMSSGLAFNEFYESNPFQSHVVDMLYINNYQDMGLFTAKRPLRSRPGTRFSYSSGETNLIMRLLQSSFENKEDYSQFPWRALFAPLGITSATWEQDHRGVFVGSSYLYMTARDLARFGKLYLDNGMWNGSELISQRFIKESLRLAPAICQTMKREKRDRYTYGLHWWLNRECPNKAKRIYPKLPQSTFMALGHHGQMLVMIPEQKAIIVRFGADKKKRFPKERWMELIYSSLQKIPAKAAL